MGKYRYFEVCGFMFMKLEFKIRFQFSNKRDTILLNCRILRYDVYTGFYSFSVPFENIRGGFSEWTKKRSIWYYIIFKCQEFNYMCVISKLFIYRTLADCTLLHPCTIEYCYPAGTKFCGMIPILWHCLGIKEYTKFHSNSFGVN